MAEKKGKSAKGWWKFSPSERRGILLLLPMLGVLVWLLSEVLTPSVDDSATLLGDALIKDTEAHPAVSEEVQDIPVPFPFDPNEISYEELRSLGVAKSTAAGIIKYRQRGKIFAIPEDFATCYGVTDSAYAVLKPYIVIGDKYRLKDNRPASAGTRKAYGQAPTGTLPPRGRDDTHDKESSAHRLSPFDPNTLDIHGFEALGFTPRQAQAIINFRKACGGFRTPEDFAKSYVVSDEMYARLKDFILIPSSGQSGAEPMDTDSMQTAASREGQDSPARAPLLELNGADSLALLAVPGIGSKTASAILSYRERLGGFHDPFQVTETGLVSERNWEAMRKLIWADSCAIRKIDINFVPLNTVAKHPYVAPRTLRRISRNRQLKGGWSTIEDMVSDNTLTAEEAARLSPYLHFGAAPL